MTPTSGGVDASAPHPRPRASRRGRFLAPLAVIVVAGICLTVWIAVSGAARPAEWNPHPWSWDPRVADIATFVEKARGLSFEHPVSVEFLADEEFRAYVTGESEREQDSDQLEQAAATLRAVGLIEGDLDLASLSSELLGANVIGLYDPGDDVLRVRGDELTPRVQVTVAHELTHALQDQHFDLKESFDRLRRDPEGSAGTPGAFRGLVEGDAVRIDHAYTRTLDAEDRAALQAAVAEDQRRLAEVDVPEVFVVAQGIPYALGPSFVEELFAAGGNPRVDDAFADPPRSNADLVDPARFMAGDWLDPPSDPPLEDGEEELARDTFDATDMMMTLGERVDPALVEAATRGYGGDRMVLFESDGRTCLRAVFRGIDDAGAAALRDAWSVWAQAMPAGVASVRAPTDESAGTGRDVVVESCDPGSDAAGFVTGKGATLMRKQAIKPAFTQELVDAGAPRPIARCIADGILERFSAEEFALAASENSETVKAAAREIATSCRSTAGAGGSGAPYTPQGP